MTKTYIQFCRNHNIPDEKKKVDVGFHMKPKSEATIQAEASALRYERRSNRCNDCFTQKSLSGSCNC